MSKIDRAEIEERVAGFLAACRERGIKATHQRLEVMRELASTEDHPDAESVYKGVQERIPTISLDTVYRALRLLEDNNIISRVASMKGRARFDANTDRHHHFACSECGLLQDCYSADLDPFLTPSEVAAVGSVDTVYLELRGICRMCGERGRREGSSRT